MRERLPVCSSASQIQLGRFLALSFFILACLGPRLSDAACSIYEPGLPKDNGVPRCACGYAYVVVGCSGPIPDVCSNCGSWTTTGCKYVGSARWTDPATNARCQCPSGACCQSNGLYRPSTYVCSAASGPCQNAAKCTGNKATCPAKTFKSSTTVCSASSGPCQNDAKCTGSSATCPAKTFKSSSTVCSAATGVCQNAAKCTGSSATCPAKTWKPSTTVCATASGACENEAKCSGSTATCPAKTLKPATTTCYTAKGPCETSTLCTGSSVVCPSSTFLSNNTICNSTGSSCFNDAKCTGSSAFCRVLSAKPFGTVCGNNSLCSTFSNNTCDYSGQCLTAECTSCPDGSFGADCTCPGGPPTSSMNQALNATCFNGTWTVIGNINGSLTIQPGTTVFIDGTVTVPPGETIKIGAGATVNVTSCVDITGTLIGLYSPRYSPTSTFEYPPECSLVSPTYGLTEYALEQGCDDAKVEPASNPGLLSLLFSVTSSCNNKKAFNYNYFVVAPVCAVAGLTGLVLGSILLAKHLNAKPNPLEHQSSNN